MPIIKVLLILMNLGTQFQDIKIVHHIAEIGVILYKLLQ